MKLYCLVVLVAVSLSFAEGRRGGWGGGWGGGGWGGQGGWGAGGGGRWQPRPWEKPGFGGGSRPLPFDQSKATAMKTCMKSCMAAADIAPTTTVKPTTVAAPPPDGGAPIRLEK